MFGETLLCPSILSFFNELLLAALGLHCYLRAFSRCGERGATLPCGLQASLYLVSLVAEHRLESMRSSVAAACGLVARGLSCPVACGIFPDQGSNPCPLHWQADS